MKAAATAGWHDRGKDSETACRDAALRQSPAVQLTSLSAIVDEKSANDKSASPDWRIGGLPEQLP